MKHKIKTISDILLIFSVFLSVISGIILNLLPSGPGSGRTILLGLIKHQWQSLHTFSGYFFILFSVLHIIFYWKIFWVNIKNLRKEVK